MHAYILNKMPSKINLNDSEVLYGPFYSIEDVDYFLNNLPSKLENKENIFTEEEPTYNYWLLLKDIQKN